MNVLIINQSEVRALLPMDACIALMAGALAVLARGEALNPLRRGLLLPDKRGILGLMPGYVVPMRMMGAKVISVFPDQREAEYDSHQGAVLLFETEQGRLLSIIDASEVTAIRTAAVSAVATQRLARKDASDLAILGSGVQAHRHLEAMFLVRSIERVRIWSRTPEHAQAFAARAARRYNCPIHAVPTAEDAVRGADLICTTTSAREPVLMGDWLTPGAHINAVGSSVPYARELDTKAIAQSRLFVDRRESALREAGDFLIPRQEGVIDETHIQGELGEVLIGRIPGRRSPEETTIFKSLGLAIEDVAAGYYIYHQAIERGAGTWVELGGQRHLD
ncbi:MAG: ornithine cyclodeaminase family protein [Acidobacteria bacterium]|nr:MAG: ornithine cyclodeaminase family protein [Acidobacteriota bacterium]